MERIEDCAMRAMDRVPVASTAGIELVIEGPMIWLSKSNVLPSSVAEKKGSFACAGAPA
jgi:hypothetical protein